MWVSNNLFVHLNWELNYFLRLFYHYQNLTDLNILPKLDGFLDFRDAFCYYLKIVSLS